MFQAILAERGDGDEITRCRGDKTGVRPRIGRPSPPYTFTVKVKNIYHIPKRAKAENIHVGKNILDRYTLIQAEHEQDNETVKSLQLCKLKRHKSENVEEWIKRLKIAAKECNYQEHDRLVKEQFMCGINDEYMQRR